jgi:hypothetical protein
MDSGPRRFDGEPAAAPDGGRISVFSEFKVSPAAAAGELYRSAICRFILGIEINEFH